MDFRQYINPPFLFWFVQKLKSNWQSIIYSLAQLCHNVFGRHRITSILDDGLSTAQVNSIVQPKIAHIQTRHLLSALDGANTHIKLTIIQDCQNTISHQREVSAFAILLLPLSLFKPFLCDNILRFFVVIDAYSLILIDDFCCSVLAGVWQFWAKIHNANGLRCLIALYNNKYVPNIG